MAKIEVECCPCDQGHYGSTYYYCSECGHDCKDYVDKCPNCGVVFDKENTFKTSPGFGGNEYLI